MKKFLLVLVLLVLLIAGGVGAMIGLSFNPVAYEKNVIQSLQKLTGRDVYVGGKTQISWLPMPTVIMRDVRIANTDKSTNSTMLEIEKVQISIAWASLLKTPLEISRVELTRPTLLLERLPSNRANFALPFLVDPNFQLQETDLLNDGSVGETKINLITVSEGVIRYSDDIKDVHFEVNNVGGDLFVDSVRGPFRFDGRFFSGKGQYFLSAGAGTFQGTTPIALSFKLVEKTTDSNLELSGQFTPTNRDKWYEGSGTFSIGSVPALTEILGISYPDNKNLSSAGGSLSVELTPIQDTLKNFIVQFGSGDDKTALTGTIARSVQNKKIGYQITLGSDRINPGDWAAYRSYIDWNALKQEGQRDIAFKVTVKSLPFGSILLKNLKLEGNYNQKGLTIDKSTVELPAGALATLSGKGSVLEQKPTLSIGFQIKMPLVTEALAPWPLPTWLKQLPWDQKGETIGRIELTPDQIYLALDSFKIGDTQIKGFVKKTDYEQDNYEVKLSLNNVHLDTLFPKRDQVVAISDLPRVLKAELEDVKVRKDLTVKGEIDILDSVLWGMPIGRGQWTGMLADSVLKTDSLRLQNLASATIGVSGTIVGLGRPQLTVEGGQLTFETKQLSSFLKQARIEADWPLIKEADEASFRLGLSGGSDGVWNLDVQTALSNASLKLNGDISASEDKVTVGQMTFDVSHPSFRTLLKSVKPDLDVLPKLDGTFKASGRFSGNQKHFELTDTTAGIGLQQLSGHVTVDNGPITQVVAEISSPVLDLERFLPKDLRLYSSMTGFSSKTFNLTDLDKWDVDLKLTAAQLRLNDLNIRQADVALTLRDKELQVQKLNGTTGTSDKSPISFSGRFDWNTTPTLTADFDLKNMPVRSDFMTLPDFAFGGGNASVAGRLKARGNSPLEMAQDLNGEGSVVLKGGQIIGADVDKMIPILTRAIQRDEDGKAIEADVKRVLHGGKTPILSLAGNYTIANGSVRMMDMTTDMTNAIANPTQIVWNIPKRTLEVSVPVTLKPLNTLPPFILGVSVAGNKGTYTPNYKDMLDLLSGRSQEILNKSLKEQEEETRALALQKKEERLSESRTLTEQARQAVTDMEHQLRNFPFDKGILLLEKAKDTLSLVNQIAVLEEPTDAQIIQQIEQSRLVLLRAQEFKDALEQETVYNTRRQMEAYQTQAIELSDQLNRWQKAYPNITLLKQLADNADKNRAIVVNNVRRLDQESSLTDIQKLVNDTGVAVDKIQKAYQHAGRFDLSNVPNEVETEPSNSEESVPNRSVRGTFKRSN